MELEHFSKCLLRRAEQPARRMSTRKRALVAMGVMIATLAPTLAVTTPPVAAASRATTDSAYALVSVSGSSLANISIGSPSSLSPVFSPSTTNYIVACGAGVNVLNLTLTGSGGLITVGSNQQADPVSGLSVSVTLSVVPNEAVVIYAPDPSGASSVPTQYWIRCLPPDFPFIQVNKTGPSSPGWVPGYYFTGTISGAGLYAMVLDGNGTPVWYQKLYLTGADNVQPLPGDIISWGTGDIYTGFDLATQTTIAPVPATDLHEYQLLPNGNHMMISVQAVSKDLSALGNGWVAGTTTVTPASAADNTVVDCIVQELDPSNNVVWSWDAADHLGVDETNTASGLPNSGPPWLLDTVNGSPEADIYHCNSVAVDEDAASPYYGDVMVSMRHLNAVYLIDPTTGDVVWKMGGTAFTPDDPEEQQSTPAKYLAVTGDTDSGFCGQHDAAVRSDSGSLGRGHQRVRRSH